MMALPKTMRKCDLRETSQITHIRKILTRAIKNFKFYQNLNDFVKSYGQLSEIFFLFTTNTHQIWLNQVTPDHNFENL